jgi:8-oxo-dGTP pyrophosphatase MutT (NUDIX family)
MSKKHYRYPKGQKVEREVSAAAAVIKTVVDGKSHYLLRYNTHWQVFTFVSGKNEPEKDGSDLSNTARREVMEELRLQPEKDFTVQQIVPGTVECVRFSKRYSKWSRYRFGIFQVFLHHPLEKVNGSLLSDTQNRWFSEDELLGKKPADGQIIGDIVFTLAETVPGGLGSLPTSIVG